MNPAHITRYKALRASNLSQREACTALMREAVGFDDAVRICAHVEHPPTRAQRAQYNHGEHSADHGN